MSIIEKIYNYNICYFNNNLSNNQLNTQIKFLKNLTIKTIFIKIIIKKK
jgi:hypothetical protein